MVLFGVDYILFGLPVRESKKAFYTNVMLESKISGYDENQVFFNQIKKREEGVGDIAT
jgi:hypothetical protein